eukprot:227862-Amorphochlora_amoeboformis.AAC.1
MKVNRQIGLKGAFDNRVKLTPKKWHYVTIVGDCKEGVMRSYIDGIAAGTITVKSFPDLKLDSEDFSVSPDAFYFFGSPNSGSMETE